MKPYKLKVEAYDGKKIKKLFNRQYEREPLKKFHQLLEMYENDTKNFKSIQIMLFERGKLIAKERIFAKNS